MTGWKTADVSKNEVPDQNASRAVPLSFSAMIGKAILMEVASRAAASVIIHIEMNARTKFRDGLNASFSSLAGAGSEGSDSLLGEGWRPSNELEDFASLMEREAPTGGVVAICSGQCCYIQSKLANR